MVAADWSLTPRWVGPGDEFRLLFLSSGERDASENQIGPYNSFIQGLAAQGHADIQSYSAGFRVVGCTFNVDARDNTGTTYTSTDKGVPIYWLNRFLVASNYEDFYDGSWDNEGTNRNEFGAYGRNTALSGNQPFTGCLNDGTGVTSGTFRTLGAASGDVRIGGLSNVDLSPLDGESNSDSTNLRPMYGLSEVFRVPFDDATLSGLELNDDGGAAVTLTPAFASVTRNYTASVAHDVVEVTIIPVNESNATYEIQDGSGTALVDADANEDDFQVEVAKGANSIKVVVTSEDALTSRTYTVAVTRGLGVPPDWSLLPAGLAPGDKFRLVFLSSTKRNGSSSYINSYNSFVQNRAAAGHTDIQAYSSGFRVVGCTEAVDARDNTETTYTNTDKGVPIYWLNGAKAADHYQDFYDGSWDDEANNKNELGANGPNTILTANYPFTGCGHDGTEAVHAGTSLALGNGGNVRVGQPDNSGAGRGPLSSAFVTSSSNARPMYGLSEVFEVHSEDATLSGLELNDDGGDDVGAAVTLTPAFASVTTDYAGSVASGVDEITIIPTVNESNATYEIQDGSGTGLVDADANEGDFQVALSAGMNTIKVVVTAQNAITSQAYTVVITRAASVPGDWSLLPSGLSPGDQFRLVFLSSTKRNGSSSGIAGYNTFIQNRAAAGHTDIQAYSSGFRVVGCTQAVDARDNTRTTYTGADKGVPIYWLNGAKVADDYQDFYNGSWDEERNEKNELGANAHDTAHATNYPLTGCEHNGTESHVSGTSYALGKGSIVTIGVLNNSGSGNGPLSSPFTTGASNTRPMYGLSEVIQVPFDDATLSGLELNDDGGSAVTLTPAFASVTTDYAASVAHDVVEVTIIPTVNERGATYEIQDGSGTALVDADANEDDFQVEVAQGANSIKVVVTAQDALTTQTYTVVVTLRGTMVPSTWSLVPAGFSPGDQFRLMFLSSTKRDGSSSDIADYNTFIQDRAAIGHLDIRAYSSGFRVVGCTEAVDARDNTGTTYTNADKGVPIYWLNGAKAADDYEDFYDGSWDEEANNKNESGNNGPNTSNVNNYPLTGCDHDGTEFFSGRTSWALGNGGDVRVGRPDTSGSSNGPIRSSFFASSSDTRPMYGLSWVFEVESSTDATLSGLELKDDAGSAITLTPAFASVTTDYAVTAAAGVDEITIIPAVTYSNATYEIQNGSGTGLVDADSNENDFQVSLSAGANTIKVVVTAEDALTTQTYTVVVMLPATAISPTWSLVPAGFSPGDQFRLVFFSSTKRDGSSSDIADYNTFIQNRAAAGHTDIQAYSMGFRVVGCTTAADAHDNTGTTYISTYKGVPIYWLNGAKAADDYEDFYDGSWDEEASNKNELGANGPNISHAANYPITGCDHDGTEFRISGISYALGSGSGVRVGVPNNSGSSNGPISSSIFASSSNSRPMYGLSEVFEVGTYTDGVTVNPTEVTVTEGGTATYTVVLDSEPTGNVTVTIQDPTDNTDVTAAATLTFTPLNWDTAQTVTVTAAQDANLTNDTVTLTHSAASTDTGYDTIAIASVTVTVTEDDAPVKPTTVTATGGDSQVALGWDAPAAAAAITHHEYRYKSASADQYPSIWTAIADSAPGEANEDGLTVRMLTNGLTYDFQVRAVNAVGASDPSEEARALAGDGLGICDRSPIVLAPTLAAIAGVSDCVDVTPNHLSAITGSLVIAPLSTALKVGDFDGLSSLEELYLQSGNRVTELPAGVFDDLSSLTKLQIGLTGIATLQPDVFSNLSSLTTLVLSFNALSVLPAGVFDGLSSLTELRLSGNSLVALPAGAFDDLSSLTQLWLDSNALTVLPAGVFDDLSSLTVLRLDTNQLTALPDGVFDGLSALTELRLSSNQLTALPAGVFDGLSALATLRLENNTVDPLLLPVTLERTAGAQFKAVAPTGIPFGLVLPVSVTNGSIVGGAGTVTIPAGALESAALAITRSVGASGATTVDIGVLPTLPANHSGYRLSKASSLPLAMPGLTVTPTTLSVDEGDTTGGSYTVVLDTQPTVDVVVTVAGHASTDVTPAPATLTFTPLNWDTAQTVTVTAAQDANLTNDTVSLTHSAASTDTDYDSIAIASVTVTVAEDDSPVKPTTVTATGGDRQVALGWDAPAAATAITHHEYRYKSASADQYPSIWTAIADSAPGEANEDGLTVRMLTNGLTYDFQVRAVNAVGASDPSEEARALAGDGLGICDRSPIVLAPTLAAIAGVSDCVDVTPNHLSAITGSLVIAPLSTALKVGDFDGLSSLEELYLQSGNRVTELPAGVFDDLSSLTKLQIGLTGIATLQPDVFSNLSSLTTLVLSFNALSVLPAGVFDGLSSLTQLRLSGNSLVALPAGAFDDLSSLTQLWLDSNALTVLPAGVFDDLSSLTVLRLDTNQLTALPDGVFDGLSALTELRLSSNQLTALPAGVFDGLSALATLRLENNTVDPLLLPVTLERTAGAQFKAVAPTGIPFGLVLPVSVTNGSIVGGAGTVTMPAGALESAALAITRSVGASGATTVDIGVLPTLPANHSGYRLSKASSLPLAMPGLTVTPTTLSVDEGDTTGGSYTVVLDTQPTVDVVVTVAGHASTDVTPAPATLTFTPLNWDTAQTVTVTAAEDADTTNDTVSLTHSAASTDTDYDTIAIASVTVTVTEDKDTAQVMGVMVTPGNAQLVLNWTAVDNATGYQVQWKSGVEDYNTGDRQATVTPGTTTDYTIGGLSSGIEYTMQVIATRTGANDGPPSEEVKGTPTVAVTVSYEQGTYEVTEDNSVTVKVQLDVDPERTLTILITHAGQDGATSADYSGVPANVTFNSGDTEKTFTVTAPTDSDDDDGESVKLGFGTLPAGVSEGTTNEAVVKILDDILPVVTITPDVTEAISNLEHSLFDVPVPTYTLTRTGSTALPLRVVLQIPENPFVYRPNGETVTIPAGETSKQVKFNISYYYSAEAGTLTVEVAARDRYVLGTPATASISMVRIESPITLELKDGPSFEVSEDAGSVTFTVVATTAPGLPAPSRGWETHDTQRVSWGLNSFAGGLGATAYDDYQPISQTRRVTGPWEADGDHFRHESTFRLDIIDDMIDEPDEGFTLILNRSTQPFDWENYIHRVCPDVSCRHTVTIIDNDTAAVTVSKTALAVTEEDTTGDTYTVVLTTQPAADVVVTVAGHRARM